MEAGWPRLGAGQVALELGGPILAPGDELHTLNQLGDPSLSELGLDDLLEELLDRVRDALQVDTVAILLLDEATNSSWRARRAGSRRRSSKESGSRSERASPGGSPPSAWRSSS